MIDSNNQFKNLSADLVASVRSIMEKKTNKHGHDPVGKEDADIDNDGDVDGSDKYLHNRRKAIAKNMKREEVELDEALDAAARYGQHHTAIKELMKSIDHHVRNHKDDALKHKDYRGKKGVHWGHVGDLAQVHSQLADIHDRLAQQGEYAMQEEVEQVDEISKELTRSYFNKALDSGVRAASRQWRPGSMSDANAAAAVVKKRAKGLGMAKDRLAKEEAEDITELSKSTMGSYVKKAADDFQKRKPKMGYDGQLKKMQNRKVGVNRALDKMYGEDVELDEAPVAGVAAGSMANGGHLCATKVFHEELGEGTTIYSQHAEPDAYGDIAWYDVMFEHGIVRHVPTDEMEILMSESHERHSKRKMKEEAELDEARGRPRKNPLPAGQESDEPEPRQHIMQQLQRAKLSMHGSSPVKFKDGTTHDVHGRHAAHLLGKYSDMKPYEKEAFQKKIGQSHANLKSEL